MRDQSNIAFYDGGCDRPGLGWITPPAKATDPSTSSETVTVTAPNLPETIALDQFLKVIGIAQTGGQAKMLIRDEQVLVNGNLETRRGRKLYHGDLVTIGARTFPVEFDSEV